MSAPALPHALGREPRARARRLPLPRAPRLDTAKVVELRLDEPLRAIEVEPRYRDLILVVRSRRRVVGRVLLPAMSVVGAEVQRAAIVAQLGEELWREHVDRLLASALPASRRPAGLPGRSISVVVCTRDRAEQLRACVASLARLRVRPLEIVVVDNCPSDRSTWAVCADLPVRYVREDVPGASRARNRGVVESQGELIAFTDDDCLVDPGWLDGVDEAFDDELVMIVDGYVGPAEVETRAQYLFEQQGGFERGYERVVFDAATASPVAAGARAGVSANVVIRRRFFEQVALFDESLGPGTPARAAEDTYANYRALAAGYRVVFDPAQVVWHRHRREYAALRRLNRDYGVAVVALALVCLLRHREPGALRVLVWWLLHRVARDLLASLARRDGSPPLDLALAQLAGTAAGPWALARSLLRGRRQAPLPPVPAAPPAPRAVAVVAEPPERISVVVPSHDRRESLRRVLCALGEQTFPRERVDVVAVLDRCRDGSAQMASALPVPYRLRVVETDVAGAGAARNRGVAACSSPLVVFLDDDIVPEPSFLAAHALARRPTDRHVVLGYCPPAIRRDGFWEQSVRAWWEDHYRRQRQPGHRWTFADFAVGNASLPRSLYAEVGGFDDSFGGRREDWELGVRLLDAGARFSFEPAAVAHHHLDTSFETTLRMRRVEARSDVELARKHPRTVGQLGLVLVGRRIDTAAASLAYRSPRAAEAAARLARPLLGVLEELRLRRHWARLSTALVHHSYLLGLTDAIASPEELLALVGCEWRDSVATARLDLAAAADLAPTAPVGPIDLHVEYGGRSLATTAAIDPNGQWDWREVERRIGAAAGWPLRRALLLERLLSAGPAGLLEEARGCR